MKNKITSHYGKDKTQIIEFHNFISEVFPNLNFNEWYKKGFWSENYIPYSIFENEKIISSTCIAVMDALVNGEKKKAIQIGAVGTLSEYRNKGFSRIILNKIIEDYQNKVDFFFLHANETVMEFYPKFGFQHLNENLFISNFDCTQNNYSARKLNIDNERDYHILLNLIINRLNMTKVFGAENYGFITMWHVLNLHRDNLYYLEKENAIIIKEEEEDTVYVLDIIFSEPINIMSALPKTIESNSIKKVKYYFPPDILHYKFDEALNVDTGLFILGDIALNDKLFRFPETAVT